MKVIDLEPKYYNSYFNCLEGWSEEMKEAGDHKACWYNKYKDKRVMADPRSTTPDRPWQ